MLAIKQIKDRRGRRGWQHGANSGVARGPELLVSRLFLDEHSLPKGAYLIVKAIV